MIRAAIPDDAFALAKLHIDSWRTAYKGIVPQDYLEKLDYQKRTVQFRDGLTTKSEETYVSDDAGEIQGFVSLGACRNDAVDRAQVGEIWGIYLAPQHWRKGIGTALCHYAENLLHSRGFVEAVLWVFEANNQARQFYETMGFKTDGADKILNPGTPLRAIRYRKILQGADQKND